MALKKTVSTLRKFKNVTEGKIEDMKKTKLKKRTEMKMMWGVRAYNEWRSVRLSDQATYNPRILQSDLNDTVNLSKAAFKFLMCKFMVEVVKIKDGKDYPGRSLYQMCVAIQKYLFSKGLKWKLIEGEFEKLRNVLDNTMKEIE